MSLYFHMDSRDYKKNPRLFMSIFENFGLRDLELEEVEHVYKMVKGKAHKKRALKLFKLVAEDTTHWTTDRIDIVDKYWNIMPEKVHSQVVTKLVEYASYENERPRWKQKRGRLHREQLLKLVKKKRANPLQILNDAVKTANFRYITRLVKENFDDGFGDDSVKEVLRQYPGFVVATYNKADLQNRMKRRKVMRELVADSDIRLQLNHVVHFTKKDLFALSTPNRLRFLQKYFRHNPWRCRLKKQGLGRRVKLEKLTREDIDRALFAYVIEKNELVSNFIKQWEASYNEG